MQYKVVRVIDNKEVTADNVQKEIGAHSGKCQFVLLPTGDLRLRLHILYTNSYIFHSLNENEYKVVPVL